MKTSHERLAEERLRLGYGQGEFAALGGVGRGAQANYEKGLRQPDMAYLEAVAAAGADVLYIVTGARALSARDVEADLERYGMAWETLELALEAAGRELSPAKKRKAAEALFNASKAEMAIDKEKLTELVLQLAA
ncbi:helix-turn-helix domain-containing protein [Achromobacter mucicolens]|uniref:helix-turn-helix domain-containing protein n=1 Tax=Achromobacter mucicolens TaxID=1389922 RepID=UPI00244A429F|nr:transcriptional regulator [Achromobacter mucicolens]MDH1522109.1 transcriptional regulator [Achromobacter mucicolens]